MLEGVDPIFIVPWLVLFAIVIFTFFWRGRSGGPAHGFKIAFITLIIGALILGMLFVLLLVVYFANGGH